MKFFLTAIAATFLISFSFGQNTKMNISVAQKIRELDQAEAQAMRSSFVL